MFNLDTLMQNLGDMLRPHAEDMRQTVDAHLQRIVARLDQIADNTASGEFTETRYRPNTITGADPADLFTVKGSEGEVEWITAMDAAGVGVAAVLRVNGTPVYPIASTAVGVGLIVQENDVLSVTGPVGARVTAQIKLKARKPAAMARGGGVEKGQPDPEPDESTHRHLPHGVVTGDGRPVL